MVASQRMDRCLLARVAGSLKPKSNTPPLLFLYLPTNNAQIVKRIQEELDRLTAEKDEEVAEMKARLLFCLFFFRVLQLFFTYLLVRGCFVATQATRDEIAGYIDDALAAEEHMELSVEEVTEEDVRVLVT